MDDVVAILCMSFFLMDLVEKEQFLFSQLYYYLDISNSLDSLLTVVAWCTYEYTGVQAGRDREGSSSRLTRECLQLDMSFNMVLCYDIS